MKRCLVLLVSTALLGTAVLQLAGEPTEAGSFTDPESAKLRSRIRELEARVMDLERQLRDLKGTNLRIQPDTSLPLPLQDQFRRDARPPNWGERTVNGLTVYIVPCAENALSTRSPGAK